MNPEFVSVEFIETYFNVLTRKLISQTDKLHLVNPSVTHAIKAVYAFEEYLEPQNYINNNYLNFTINDRNEVLLKGDPLDYVNLQQE